MIFMGQYLVTGMSCAACQARVEKAVGKVPGVDSVSVSLLTNSMKVEGKADPEEIIRAVEDAGYGAEAKGSDRKSRKMDYTAEEEALKDRETPRLRRRLIISIGFLLALMYITMGFNMWGWPLPEVLAENYLVLTLVQMVLAATVMLINHEFYSTGFKALIKGAPNMNTLVALGSFVSFSWSVYVFFSMCGMVTSVGFDAAIPEPKRYLDYFRALDDQMKHSYHHYLWFESAAMIPALITVGKLLEAISKGRTTSALKGLMDLAPKTAVVIREGQETEISVDDVKIGDVFVIRPGDRIPADGVVLSGSSAVDESALTGESIPVDKTRGDPVSTATINQSGYLTCQATRIGEDTTLAQIIQLVSDAAASKAPIARIADRVSGIFVPVVIALATLVVVGWMSAGYALSYALPRGISVLVVSCPCALGLATPVAIMVGNGLGAKNGVLFKTSEALETLGKATVVALDKTGTITSGEPRVTSILPADGISRDYLLQRAYALEKRSEHPLAKAIVAEVEGEKDGTAASKKADAMSADQAVVSTGSGCDGTCDLFMIENFSIRSGNGLEGTIAGKHVHGGSGKYIRTFAAFPKEITDAEEKAANSGETPLFFEEDGKLLGMISVADTMKEDSSEGIRQLKNLGLTVVMLTGDNERTARAIGNKAEVDHVIAGVLPDGKGAVIQSLQTGKASAATTSPDASVSTGAAKHESANKVIMVGDGINDAPALTTADIGIAIGAGTDVAIESADVVLMNSTLTDVAAAIRLSRKTVKNIHENLFWAFFYNLICIPVAAGILSWKMNPMIGAAAMSISSFTVCMNALRLNLFKMHDSSHDKPLHGKSPEEITIPETEKRSTTMKKTLKIDGMMCGHCEATVKKALEALPFISCAAPDHNAKNCVIEVSDEAAWDESAVKAAIEDKDFSYLGVE